MNNSPRQCLLCRNIGPIHALGLCAVCYHSEMREERLGDYPIMAHGRILTYTPLLLMGRFAVPGLPNLYGLYDVELTRAANAVLQGRAKWRGYRRRD